MAIISIEHRKAGPRRHLVTVVDDDGELTERITVPDPIPEEFSNQGEYVRARTKRMVKIIRSRKASDDERDLEQEQWKSLVNQDSSQLLTDLQTELDP